MESLCLSLGVLSVSGVVVGTWREERQHLLVDGSVGRYLYCEGKAGGPGRYATALVGWLSCELTFITASASLACSIPVACSFISLLCSDSSVVAR